MGSRALRGSNMRQSIEDTIERVVDMVEIKNNINYPSKDREITIKHGVQRIMDTIREELNPIVKKLKEVQE